MFAQEAIAGFRASLVRIEAMHAAGEIGEGERIECGWEVFRDAESEGIPYGMLLAGLAI